MALAVGTLLGPYEILSQIGAGGMGEVYKARDTRLDRIVAIKVLSAHLVRNTEARLRFRREAETIANLQHPNICVLYDIGEQDGMQYLVMEYLEGESLATRLMKGPLPVDQVLRYAIEISDALDKAHRQGFTHRDIKPANIMITKSGSQTTSKILDFGLAKLKQEAAPPNIPLSELPTAPRQLTGQGTILGTLQYMAPEQVEGKIDELDARTDIFSFGATVYEMATAKKAFEGKTQASLIGSIMHTQPPSISSMQPMSPPALDRVVKTCLEKAPEDRFQTAHDLWLQLKWIAEGGSQAGIPAPVAAHRKRREKLAWAAAAVLLIATASLAFLWFNRPSDEQRLVRFSLGTPENVRLDTNPQVLNISPDGSMLALNTTDSAGRSQLWIRSLDSLTGQPLPGTEERNQAFWSADSRFVAFYADGKLKKIAVSGGSPQTIADAPGGGNGASGSWNREGTVLFVPIRGGVIHRVSESGGAATPVTTLDTARNEVGHGWPHFLPDGKHFLYLARSTTPENNAIFVGSLDSNERKLVVNANSNVAYVLPGYLLFNREGTLMAQPFDADRLEFTDRAVVIAEDVQFNGSNGRTAFAASLNGVLAYRTGGASQIRQLTWFDRTGRNLGPVGEPADLGAMALSPDERRVAVERLDPAIGTDDIWLLELSRGIFSRLTSSPSHEGTPIWSPDGRQIAFSSNPKGEFHLYRKTLSSGEEEMLLESVGRKIPEEWSSDGQLILYSLTQAGKTDVWFLPMSGERKPAPLLVTSFDTNEPHVSPDGRWLAYDSEESGDFEVYVQPFLKAGEKLRVSSNGGGQPRWRGDGKELFYLALDGRMMAVPISAGAAIELGVPKSLFQTGLTNVIPTFPQYVVTRDGQRFLVNASMLETSPTPITVVLNWTAGLEK